MASGAGLKVQFRPFFSNLWSKGYASVCSRMVGDWIYRLPIEYTHKYFEVHIKETLMFPAGTLRRRLRCPIMIQQVYEIVHLCYKVIGLEIFMPAAGASSGSLNFKFIMISDR